MHSRARSGLCPGDRLLLLHCSATLVEAVAHSCSRGSLSAPPPRLKHDADRADDDNAVKDQGDRVLLGTVEPVPRMGDGQDTDRNTEGDDQPGSSCHEAHAPFRSHRKVATPLCNQRKRADREEPMVRVPELLQDPALLTRRWNAGWRPSIESADGRRFRRSTGLVLVPGWYGVAAAKEPADLFRQPGRPPSAKRAPRLPQVSRYRPVFAIPGLSVRSRATARSLCVHDNMARVWTLRSVEVPGSLSFLPWSPSRFERLVGNSASKPLSFPRD